MPLLNKSGLRNALRVIKNIEHDEFEKAYEIWEDFEKDILRSKTTNTLDQIYSLYQRFKAFDKFLEKLPTSGCHKNSAESAQIIHAYFLKILNLQILAHRDLHMDDNCRKHIKLAEKREEPLNELLRASVEIQANKIKKTFGTVSFSLSIAACISTAFLPIILMGGGCVCGAAGTICCCSQSTDDPVRTREEQLVILNQETSLPIDAPSIFSNRDANSTMLVIPSPTEPTQNPNGNIELSRFHTNRI